MRAKKNPKALWWLAGGAAVGAAGWIGLRLYIRKQVAKALVEEYDYETWKSRSGLAELIGIDLNLPTVDEFAASVTPLWSAKHPEKAIADVIEKGRASIYWPANRRTVGSPKVDAALWSLLRTVVARQEQKKLETK
jgi:hypothetical protein